MAKKSKKSKKSQKPREAQAAEQSARAQAHLQAQTMAAQDRRAAFLMDQLQAALSRDEARRSQRVSAARGYLVASPLLGLLAAAVAAGALTQLSVSWQSICLIAFLGASLLASCAAFIVAMVAAVSGAPRGRQALDPFSEAAAWGQLAPKDQTVEGLLELTRKAYAQESMGLQAAQAAEKRLGRVLGAVRVLMFVAAGALALGVAFLLVLLIVMAA